MVTYVKPLLGPSHQHYPLVTYRLSLNLSSVDPATVDEVFIARLEAKQQGTGVIRKRRKYVDIMLGQNITLAILNLNINDPTIPIGNDAETSTPVFKSELKEEKGSKSVSFIE